MNCEVEYTDEFEDWWNTLTEDEQKRIAVIVDMLETLGTQLQFPYTSGIKDSKHSHMRELRAQYSGNPYRVLYAFDPNRNAILLIGGDKTGNDNWYNEYVPIADKLYDEHLQEIATED